MHAPVPYLPVPYSPVPSDKTGLSSKATAHQAPSHPNIDSPEVWQLFKGIVIQDAMKQASEFVDRFDTRQQGE